MVAHNQALKKDVLQSNILEFPIFTTEERKQRKERKAVVPQPVEEEKEGERKPMMTESEFAAFATGLQKGLTFLSETDTLSRVLTETP